MGQYDWECYTGCDNIYNDGLRDDLRIYCYWKCNGWRYNMSPVYGYTYFQGGNEACVFDGAINFQDNQSTNLLGYHDYRVWRGQSTINSSYQSRIISNSTYVSGDKWSGSGSYATGALASHTVSYNANGGSGAPGSQTKWYGSVLTLSSTQPSRTGYTFQGWATSSGGSVAYSPGGQYGADSDVTLYAVWKANTWTVSYNANGGSGAPGSQTKTYGQTLTLSSTIPTRTDYNFKGWNTKSDGTGTSYSAGGSYTNNSAVTLYAQWELAYVKPRLSNVRIARCDTSGNWSDSGTKIRVDFDYATDLTGIYAKLQYKSSSASSWTDAASAILSNSSTKSGSISKKNFSETFSIETSYSARIMIYDSKGTSYATYSGEVNIPTQQYPIDIKSGGTGIAFGKVAETNNLVDSAWGIKAPIARTKLEAINNRNNTTDANIPHTYENSNAHMQLVLATDKMTSNAPVSNGYIISFSWDNSGAYDAQLFVSNGTDRMQMRSSPNGSWNNWKNIDVEIVLYNNTEGTNGTVTLSQSAANFRYIEIFYKDIYGNYPGFSHVKVYEPNGKRAETSCIQKTGANDDSMRFNTRSLIISGTSITVESHEVDYDNGGRYNVNEQRILRVIGYR